MTDILKAHVSINVRNVERSIDFYRRMLGIEPSKVRTGYAKFDVQNPPLNLALNEVPIPRLAPAPSRTSDCRSRRPTTCWPSARGGPRRAWSRATRCRPTAATPRRTRPGSTIRTATNGKPSSCSGQPAGDRRARSTSCCGSGVCTTATA